MDTPELWQFTSSHFNEKARWALDFKRVPHIRHSLIPGFHVPVVKRMTGKTHVPVLKLNGTAITDSSKIIEALERAYPEPALYPADPEQRRRALELEDFFDEELGPYIRRWIFHVILPYPKFVRAAFVSHASPAAQLAQRAMSPLIGVIMRRQMNINPATAEVARAKTIAAMDRLERELQPSGYLVGDSFTVADLTAAALLSPLVRPPEFPYKAAAPIPEPFAKIRDSSLDPSRVPMDASDLHDSIAANRQKSQPRRVYPVRGPMRAVPRPPRVSSRSHKWGGPPCPPPATARSGTGHGLAGVEPRRRLETRSSKPRSGACWPAVRKPFACRKSPPTPASRIPRSSITSAAAKAWSKRWSCAASRIFRRNFSKDGRARRNPTSRAYSIASTKSHRTAELRGCSRG